MLSLVHLIYMAGDKCMRQNACLDLKYADLGNQLDDSKLSWGNSTRELLKHNKDKL